MGDGDRNNIAASIRKSLDERCKLAALVRRHDVHWHVVDGKAPPEDLEYARQLAKDALAVEE